MHSQRHAASALGETVRNDYSAAVLVAKTGFSKM